MIELTLSLVGQEFRLLGRSHRFIHGHAGVVLMLMHSGCLWQRGNRRKGYSEEQKQFHIATVLEMKLTTLQGRSAGLGPTLLLDAGCRNWVQRIRVNGNFDQIERNRAGHLAQGDEVIFLASW